MDSINREQPEKTRENLQAGEAIAEMKKLIDKAKTCFFCTNIQKGAFKTRPMSVHSDFLTVSGTATISRDKAKIKELWEPILKDWFTGGADDPRVTVICVKPHHGYDWDTKHGLVVATANKLIGTISGKTLDDSVEGKLKV